MPIRRGEDWGETGGLGPNGVLVDNDAEARRLIEEARRTNRPLPELGLLGGDLCRTLGGRGDADAIRSLEAWRFDVDLGAVLLDGRLFWFCAHLVARRKGWAGEALVAMNAAWRGTWNLGPKAHPGDGLLDISHGHLSTGDRLRALRRVGTGDHLPHPQIRCHRTGAFQVEFQGPLMVELDGEPVQRASNVSIRVEPAALTVVV
ncbi:MAG: hypothetical protein F4129_07170 [Acidimicrobiia bacterium]|nr:hypothetical protein [bacterium]MXZ84406.1 hypothetical protein [Acidimicrobiia bacterium]MYG72852.1 hypothetical protein [Acidimicrobiia bacterium]MYH96273.1 hypothetical protein [Acidimicrobiia bacterium]MYL10120.1 hypothetical protein [Acidimicrobiia bacterium]